MAGRVPDADAEVVRRLREAGAILLGKLNMDECAYGVTSTSGHFGAVSNPWQPERVAGGSSGGAAAAVAAGLCFGALGTDTGGSIRLPAAWCGVVGLMPTYGLVSTRGVIPLAWSLDHVGPMGRTVDDAAMLLQAIAGYDPADPGSAAMEVADYGARYRGRLGALRLGRVEACFDGLDPEVEQVMDKASGVLEEITGRIRSVELPAASLASLMFVEGASYFGPAVERTPDLFSPAVRALVQTGTRISASTYAEERRRLVMIRRAARQLFDEVDLLVSPTAPDLPATIEASRQPPTTFGPPRSARNTTPFNVCGLPTISIPAGFSGSGLPVGLQISGPPGGELQVLALARAYQSRTGWHEQRPGTQPLSR